MSETMEAMNEWLPALIPLVLALVAISLVFGLFRRLRQRLTGKRPQHEREIRLVTRLLSNLVAVIIVLVLLEVLNVPLGNVWTAVSTVIALVAIGFFAVWSILSHLTAAVVLMLQRPFRPGDMLQFGDEEYRGKVIQTGAFFTRVEDADGGHSQIPNNLLFQKRFRVTHETR